MIRSLSTFEPLKPAEASLLLNSKLGTPVIISDVRPEKSNSDNIVRATFLRFLTLGGDELNRIHERGLFLKGAWIESDLDFEGTLIYQSLGLINCHINKVIFRYCSIKGFIGFQGCFVEGIEGDSLKCAGDVFINEGFISSGTVRFCDAQIDGSLDCQNATLFGDCIENDFSKTMSLICENAVIGNVFLNNRFSAYGTVNLVGTQIKGNLICDEGKFDHNFGIALTCMNAVIKGNVSFAMGFEAHGQVCLSGAQIGSLNLHKAKLNRSTDSYALRAENMDVKGIFAFRELQVLTGNISLMGSRVVLMEDDLDAWPRNNLLLDGFEYRKFAGSAPTAAAQRLIWVNKQILDHLGLTNKGADFRPQPWVQLQKVLLEMGHYEDAKQIGITFEEHRNKNKLIYRDAAWIYKKVSIILHKAYGLLIDYGYRPIKLLLISFSIFIICGGFYFYAAYQDVFAPSNPLVFQNGDYDVCKSDNKKSNF